MDDFGPASMGRSETTSAASPVAAAPGSHFGVQSFVRPLAGLGMVIFVLATVAIAVGLFQGRFTSSVPVTVLSPRAGLVMNPDAKVKMRGVEVGRVASIEYRSDGDAAIHLAMDPSQLHFIPANVRVNITAPTVFGAKFVQLLPPADPSPKRLQAGQILDADHVTVETDTLFEELVSVMSKIEPAKLNETLGAFASGVNGRGHKIGQMLADFDNVLATMDPSLSNLRHDIATAPPVLRAYADASDHLIATADNATKISQTFVDEQQNLDGLLLSTIGLADIGNDVVSANRQSLTSFLHDLVPTTDLLNEYGPALNCGLAGLGVMTHNPALPKPGAVLTISFPLGVERYRYPGNLPKVAATGGPHCADQGLPDTPFGWTPPFLVTDVGANPAQYNNQGPLLNADGLKQLLYGPIDGPPRNTAQIGQPG